MSLSISSIAPAGYDSSGVLRLREPPRWQLADAPGFLERRPRHRGDTADPAFGGIRNVSAARLLQVGGKPSAARGGGESTP